MRADAAPATPASAPLFARLAATQSNSPLTTWTDVTGLSVPVEIGTYTVKAVLQCYAETATDLQFRFTVPTSTVYILNASGFPLNVSSGGDATAVSSANGTGTNAGVVYTGTEGNYAPVTIRGALVVTTAGTAQLQYNFINAQGNASVRSGSYVELLKVP